MVYNPLTLSDIIYSVRVCISLNFFFLHVLSEGIHFIGPEKSPPCGGEMN